MNGLVLLALAKRLKLENGGRDLAEADFLEVLVGVPTRKSLTDRVRTAVGLAHGQAPSC